MNPDDARLYATRLVHDAPAIVNDAMTAVAHLCGVHIPLDPLTWTESEIDQLVAEFQHAIQGQGHHQ